MSSSSSGPSDLLTYISTNLSRNKLAGRITDTGLSIFNEIVATNIRLGLPIDLIRLAQSRAPDVRQLVRIGRIRELLEYFGFEETGTAYLFRFSGAITPEAALVRIARFSVLYQSWAGVPGVAYATVPGTEPTSADVTAASNVMTDRNSENGSEIRRREKEQRIHPSLLTPVREEDAGGGGDCFYYSLYASLEAQSLLDTVCSTFGLGKSRTKEDFNRSFRRYLASQLPSELLSMIDYLCTIPIGSRGIQLGSLSDEYQIILRNVTDAQCKNNDYKKDLVRQLQAATSTDRVWAGQPEVRLTKHLLTTVGIVLHIDNDEGYPAPPPTAAFVYAPNRIILRRVHGNHYHWYRFLIPKGGRRIQTMKKTRRVKKHSRRHL
jgi:hypothetical protein